MGTCPKPRTGRKRPPLSRSIRSATSHRQDGAQLLAELDHPCSCNDAQATTPCTSPPDPFGPDTLSLEWYYDSGYHGGLLYHPTHHDGQPQPYGIWSIHT
jgi:hypothetical protein